FPCAGPLKRTKSNRSNFIIAVDYFSKYCMAEVTIDTTGETTVNFARYRTVNVFGTPQAFITDQSRNFESQKFKYFCDQNKIKKLRTTAYQCKERNIRTIKQMLCIYVNDSHDDWDECLQSVIFANNNTRHSTTNVALNVIKYEVLNQSLLSNLVLHYNRMRKYNERKPEEMSRNLVALNKPLRNFSPIVEEADINNQILMQALVNNRFFSVPT
ncbi:unnamed protein product, partial [Brachionus calyciflorus]